MCYYNITGLCNDLNQRCRIRLQFFDAHARNSFGTPDPDGTAVVLKFADIVEVEQFLCALSNETHSRFFEIVPVQFLKPNSECETLGVKTLEQQSDGEVFK